MEETFRLQPLPNGGAQAVGSSDTRDTVIAALRSQQERLDLPVDSYGQYACTSLSANCDMMEEGGIERRKEAEQAATAAAQQMQAAMQRLLRSRKLDDSPAAESESSVGGDSGAAEGSNEHQQQFQDKQHAAAAPAGVNVANHDSSIASADGAAGLTTEEIEAAAITVRETEQLQLQQELDESEAQLEREREESAQQRALEEVEAQRQRELEQIRAQLQRELEEFGSAGSSSRGSGSCCTRTS